MCIYNKENGWRGERGVRRCLCDRDVPRKSEKPLQTYTATDIHSYSHPNRATAPPTSSRQHSPIIRVAPHELRVGGGADVNDVQPTRAGLGAHRIQEARGLIDDDVVGGACERRETGKGTARGMDE